MLSATAGLLIVFYIGAVCFTGRAWLQVLQRQACIGAIRLAMARCRMTALFGTPLEPDVWMT